MARQPSGTGSAEDSDFESDLDSGDRPAAVNDFWSEVRVQPVEIALPKGVGYTLRAYRLSTEIVAPDVDEREDEFAALHDTATAEDEDDVPEIDEAELTELALAAGGRRPGRDRRVDEARRKDEDDDDDLEDDLEDEDEADEDEADEDDDLDDDADSDDDDEDDSDDEDEDDSDDDDGDEEDEDEPEEVPVFLAQRGRLLLFPSPESLVEYVRGDDEHDMTQLDTWSDVRDRIEPDDVVPLGDDRYELDLVVENLRGGHDAWDPALIIKAGEIARDVGYALRLEAVVSALSPGSPLDDLDEGLRTVDDGGLGAFFARRRLRKIGAQTTAALGWRTIIGKISAVVDWRN